MEEFLTKLYSYEHFETYLIVAIIVLVILFIIILFMGKKDKTKREIEATKKLMQINTDTLNESTTVSTPVSNDQEKLENDTIIVPNINDLNVASTTNDIPEPVIPPVVENNDLPIVDETPIAFKEEEDITPVEVPNEPILPPIEEKPFEFEDFKAVDNNTNVNPEPIVSEPEVSVPDFNFDEIAKNVEEVKEEKPFEGYRSPEIFSSVYVPESKEVKEEKEEEIELPALKKDAPSSEKIENPRLSNFNLDDISGETYNIK